MTVPLLGCKVLGLLDNVQQAGRVATVALKGRFAFLGDGLTPLNGVCQSLWLMMQPQAEINESLGLFLALGVSATSVTNDPSFDFREVFLTDRLQACITLPVQPGVPILKRRLSRRAGVFDCSHQHYT
jgi:hypothetical protein